MLLISKNKMVLKTFKAVKFHSNAIVLKALFFSQTAFCKLSMSLTSSNGGVGWAVAYSIGGVDRSPRSKKGHLISLGHHLK